MKLPRILPFLALLIAPVFAQTPAPTFTPAVEPDPEVLAAPDADAAWKPLAQFNNMDYLIGLLGDAKGAEKEAVVRNLYVRIARTSVAFYQKYPNDSRRWFAVRSMSDAIKALAKEDGTPKVAIEGMAWDPAAWVEWRKQVEVLVAASATAPDAPLQFKLSAEVSQPGGLKTLVSEAGKALKAKEPVDLGPIKAEIFRLAAKYPKVATVGQYVGAYLALRTQAGATKEEKRAELQEFIAQPSEALHKAAQTELKKLTIADRPIEIAFTAVDGRKVDLKDLKGKVVLVDFWATWCGPCKAEIPNIKKVYAAYHDKGFEIIGVSLENAHLTPGDKPEQTAAKLEKAKKILTDFTTTAEMPWPQYIDGKWWKNEISTRYEIGSIPAMFLIDQQGKLVTTAARGPKLEAEVKRLLKL